MIGIDLLIRNAAELLTLSPSFKEESGLGMIQNGAIALREGKIFWIGKTPEIPKEFSLSKGGQEIDTTGKVVMPGSLTPIRISSLPGRERMNSNKEFKEVIQAATIHSERSMGREKEIGSLECGKQADLLVLDIPNYRYLPYHFGVDHTEYVIKCGKIVYQRPT